MTALDVLSHALVQPDHEPIGADFAATVGGARER